MKFLCGNCKAKYQIPDEKVVGKTLRMRCHKCGRDIIVGPKTPSTAPAAPGQSKSSALGEEFAKQLKVAPPPPTAALTPLDQWHVSVNDVPVGPIKREEVERKVQMGAVTGDSLCWREGFDDWKPLKDVPELAALLRKSRPTPYGMQAPRASSPGAVPAPPWGAVQPKKATANDENEESTRLHQAPGFDPFPAEVPTSEKPRPMSSADEVASAFAALRSAENPLVSPSAIGELPELAPKKPRRTPVGQYFMYGGIVAFCCAVAAVIAIKTIQPQIIRVRERVESDGERSGPDLVFLEQPWEGGNNGEGEIDQATGRRRPSKIARKTGDPAQSSGTNGMSAEDQELLRKMGGPGGGLSGSIRVDQPGATQQGTQAVLTEAQLNGVRGSHRMEMQRCYETAFRGQRNTPQGRINVGITVSAMGRVINVRVDGGGADFTQVRACLEQNVRRWVFPASRGATETVFPVVFSQGG